VFLKDSNWKGKNTNLLQYM